MKWKEVYFNCVIISELCNQNIQQFFLKYPFELFFARSSDNKIFSSGNNYYKHFTRGIY